MMRDRKEGNVDGCQLKGGEMFLQGDRHDDRLTDRFRSGYGLELPFHTEHTTENRRLSVSDAYSFSGNTPLNMRQEAVSMS